MFQKIIANKKNLLISLLLLTLVVYLPTLFFHYVYLDDYLMVQEPGFHSNLKYIPGSFFRSIWPYSSNSYQYYRPVSVSLYILGTWTSMQISGEILPWVYHLTNLLLKLGVVALFFNFISLMGASLITTGVFTLLFAVHPALAGTIGWIPGQNELLLTIFILSSFIALIKYTKTNQTKWLILHSVFFWLGLLTKENAIILPILSAIYLFSAGYTLKKLPKFVFGWAGAIGMWFIMLKFGAGQKNPVNENVITSIFQHMHYALVYLGKIFFPYPLSTLPTFYDTPTVILFTAALGLLFFLYVFLKKSNSWITLLGIVWFAGFLLPTLSMAWAHKSTSFILREDRGYLAAIGVWIVFLQVSWPQKFLKQKTIIIAAIASLFAIINFIHQQNYRSGKAFYSNATEGSPHLAFGFTHLGDMYIAESNLPAAIESYQKGIQLNPNEPNAHNNLAVAYMRSGQKDLAIKELQIELSVFPNNILALYNLGVLILEKNQIAEAETLFRRAVKINPVYTDAWQGLAAIYTYQKNEKGLEEAKRGLMQSEWDMSKGL